MWKQPRFLEPTGNLIQPHLPLSFSYFPWIPNHLGCFREPYVIYKELLSDCLGGLSVLLFFHASCSFFSLRIAMWKEKTDHRGGLEGRKKEHSVVSWLRKLQHPKSLNCHISHWLLDKLNKMAPFRSLSYSARQPWVQRGASATEKLNGGIILSIATMSKGPFHTYHHLLWALLKFLRENDDDCHCIERGSQTAVTMLI